MSARWDTALRSGEASDEVTEAAKLGYWLAFLAVMRNFVGQPHPALPSDPRAFEEPANALLIIGSGWVNAAIGHDVEAAFTLLQRTEHRGPDDSTLFIILLELSACHFQQRQFDQAIRWASESVARRSNYAFALSFLAAAHAHAGRPDDARATFARIPPETPHAITIGMLRNPKAQERLREGLRLAGADV